MIIDSNLQKTFTEKFLKQSQALQGEIHKLLVSRGDLEDAQYLNAKEKRRSTGCFIFSCCTSKQKQNQVGHPMLENRKTVQNLARGKETTYDTR